MVLHGKIEHKLENRTVVRC